MSIVFRDFGTAYLAAPLAIGGLTITVDSPASLPVLQAGDYFYLVLQKYSDRSYVEIVKVTATNGAVFTVERGQSGTTPRVFAVGDYAELRLTTDALTEYTLQNIATKMDKSGGGDFNGIYRFLNPSQSRIDVVRVSDSLALSLVADYSASEGHRAILGGLLGPNAVTPSILLRPNGYTDSTGQLKLDSAGSLDVVDVKMRGSQGLSPGSAVRLDYLSANYIDKSDAEVSSGKVMRVNGFRDQQIANALDSKFPASDVFQLSGTGSWASVVGKVPRISTDGVLEVGQYIDFHTSGSTADFDIRMNCRANGRMEAGGRWEFVSPLMLATGNDYYNGSIELLGNGAANTVFPTLGFHQPTVFAGSIQQRNANEFHFFKQGASAHADVVAGSVHSSAVFSGDIFARPAVGWRDDSGVVRFRFHMPGADPGDGIGIHRYGASGAWEAMLGKINYGGVLYWSGNVEANDVYIRSDRRLKSNFTNVESPLDKVCSLSGMYYDKKSTLTAETTSREFGIIAQDLEKVLPEGVNKSSDDDEILSVSNSAVNALLVEAIKELSAKVDALTAHVEELENGKD